MDLAAATAALLAHYIAMAALPGAKAHAWHQVNELAKQCPQLYADFPRLVTQAMKEKARD